jgi:hypothetical protein
VAQQGFPPGRHSREPEARPEGVHDHSLPADEATYPEQDPYQSRDPYQTSDPYYSSDPYRSDPYRAAGKHGSQPAYGDDLGYQGSPGHPDQVGYRGEPDYQDPAGYQDRTNDRDQVGYEDRTNDRDPVGYEDRTKYRDAAGYRGEPGYQDQPGYRADSAAAPPGYPGQQSRPGPASGPDRGSRAARPWRQDRPRPERGAWQRADPFAQDPDTDSDLPPWAGPALNSSRQAAALRQQTRTSVHPDAGASVATVDADSEPGLQPDGADDTGRLGRRRGRAAATRLRKSRRRVYRWGVLAIVACVAAAGIAAIVTHHTPKPALYVTALQAGEFKAVPSACSSVSTATLNQFLPGGRTTTGNFSSATDSQCSFTVDARPNFLVLELQAQAYEPFAAAAGDGSASGNAQDNFVSAQLVLAHPPKKSPVPPAQISKLTGLGQQAFLAFQNEHVSGIVTDVVTVVIRDRNVVITVSMSGQESGHGFGPVPVSTLTAGATAAAKSMLAKVNAEPTA